MDLNTIVLSLRKYDHILGRTVVRELFSGLIPEGVEPGLFNLPEENYQEFYDRLQVKISEL